ncbi:MBL fold metallo-hydrolase [Burkholderia sp. MSMB617WGS]|uniref:MBL fold metallo-hydrolase n=1 Tax=Burkholderia TaxID=32008 RepID=UPI00075AE817|nr:MULTISPECIES: MBL fold metallo-hydrolase [Burkholderia]AOJ83954.1 MBL fold metallo-hydrolase [Burkholderia savannae]AOK49820.1 MBL fold metallo-hydrolase [Burkholderia sp. MSMB617WGS]KWZ47851.1 MBL fold metallo-hydrolase [Burkholderia savannae]
MKLWLLGTGTPTPSTSRMCSGYLVEAGGDYIVFDHGFGSHHRLLELGVSATRISHAFFSHHHYDHMGDYPRLLLTRWDQGAGRIPELKVYGPPPLRKITDRLFGDDGAFGPDLVSRTENQASIDVYRARGGEGARARPRPVVTELSPLATVTENEWTVQAVAVNHFAPHLVSYGYRIDHDGQSIVYSGDTGPCPALDRLAKDCDVLVHMCHYLSGTAPSRTFAAFTAGHLEVAQAARQANAKNLVISHVTEQFDKPGVRERVIVEMSRIYSGNIFFGSDRMEIPVSGPQASKLD